MNRFLKIIFTVLFFLQFTTLSGKPAEKKLQFSFDDRTWEKGHEYHEAGYSITEYTLKGETVENWTELVSVMKMSPVELTPAQFYEGFVKSSNPRNIPFFSSKIIQKGRNTIFFEWNIAQGPRAEHEWLKLIKTAKEAWILRYTTKKLSEIEKIRPTWEKILSEAKLEKVS